MNPTFLNSANNWPPKTSKSVAVIKKSVKVVQLNKNYYFCMIFSIGEGAV